MKILITGIYGFVGSNLVKGLPEKYHLYGLDQIKIDNQKIKKQYSWEEINKIVEVDVIIHLAGIAHDTNNMRDAKEYFDINVGLTKKIFSHFLKSKTERFIFFSTVKAVSEKVSGDILTESAIPNPKSVYGKSKLEAEKYIQSQKLIDNKKVYILRPCMIHGPNNKGNLNELYKFIKKGIPYPLGAFKNRRSFLSILNLIYIIEKLVEFDVNPGVYHIADDEALSIQQLVELISLSLNKKPCIWKIPKIFVNFLGSVGSLLHLPFNSDKLTKLAESYVVSNKKIKDALSMDRMPVSAVDGVKYTLESFK